ncbi:MAG: DUF4230 domain-containing protein [Anaerolineae bacterium]|jgi:hypothetical protein
MADDDKMTPFLRRNILFLIALVALIAIAVIAWAILPDLARVSRALFPGDDRASMPVASPPPTPSVSIAGIRAAAKLSTVEYRTVAEVQNERVPDDVRQYFGGGERILLLVYGDVRAGFDLSKLTEDDLWADGTRVQLHLPAPEILSTSLDLERTHVVYYQKSLLVSHDVNLEREALKTADDAIRQAAIDANILENATRYGQLFFENFLRSLGFTEVEVIVN